MSVTVSSANSGTLSSTGSSTEDTVFEETSAGMFRGYIDLTNLAGVDATITVREYIKIGGAASYKKINQASYYGPQIGSNEVLELPTREVLYSYKVTLTDDGSSKNFDWLEEEIG